MMHLTKFEHLSPTMVEEACHLLDKHGPKARILAGGSDLFVAMKLRNIQPTYLISLKGIGGIKGINYHEEEGLKVGAMTSLYQVRKDPFIMEHYQALAQAAAVVGSPQIQRMGTLGGNLLLNTRCFFYNQSSIWRRHRPVCLKMGGDVCHVVGKGNKCYAVFSADTPPALIALGAKVRLVSSKGTRWVQLKDLYTGNGKEPIALHPNEILTEIQLPPVANQVSTYLKYRMRMAIDFPLVGVAARMVWDGRKATCLQAKIVLNALSPAPMEVPDAEALCIDSFHNHETITKVAEGAVRIAHPVANTNSTPTYRREMAGILTEKALNALVARER
jgi:4-hydroxybenzoyl-CoA reductase subunit beta